MLPCYPSPWFSYSREEQDRAPARNDLVRPVSPGQGEGEGGEVSGVEVGGPSGMIKGNQFRRFSENSVQSLLYIGEVPRMACTQFDAHSCLGELFPRFIVTSVIKTFKPLGVRLEFASGFLSLLK